MIRPPPRSTLFPYPTLSRSLCQCEFINKRLVAVDEFNRLRTKADYRRVAKRSEEHTSELQSQSNLVCRLLLEKKKKREPRPMRSTHRCRGARTPTAELARRP